MAWPAISGSTTPARFVLPLPVTLLLLANTINKSVPMSARWEMPPSLCCERLVPCSMSLIFRPRFGRAFCRCFLKYEQYVRVLQWLSLALLAYMATLFVVKIDWTPFAGGILHPAHHIFRQNFLTADCCHFRRNDQPISLFLAGF